MSSVKLYKIKYNLCFASHSNDLLVNEQIALDSLTEQIKLGASVSDEEISLITSKNEIPEHLKDKKIYNSELVENITPEEFMDVAIFI